MGRVFYQPPPPILFDHSLKRTKFEDKTVKSTQLSLVPVGLHDFQIFPHRTGYAWSVEAGNICSVSVLFVRVGSQISPLRAKKDSNIPSLGRTRSVKCPTPGPTKTIKSPPHALPPPRRHDIDRCIIKPNLLFAVVVAKLKLSLWGRGLHLIEAGNDLFS